MNYDFDSILQRLKQALEGQVSAMEGTFTGDILQAVAAELARIWSQEIDTVTQRGFVATAEGLWLDAACSDYGVTRKTGESDEKLRQRVLDHIRARGASGNAADYVAWALELEGVAAAAAVPLGRGAGTVDVYFAPEDGADSEMAQKLQRHLALQRPVGADVKVIQATPVTVHVAASVTPSGETPLSTIQTAMEQALDEYLGQARLTEGGQLVSINRVIGLLLNCEGVADAADVPLCQRCEKIYEAPSVFPPHQPLYHRFFRGGDYHRIHDAAGYLYHPL